MLANFNVFLNCLHKIVFRSKTKKFLLLQALLYTLTFEKTALLEKSTFQTPLNVYEFGLR